MRGFVPPRRSNTELFVPRFRGANASDALHPFLDGSLGLTVMQPQGSSSVRSPCSNNQVSRGRSAPSNTVPLTPAQVLFAPQVLALQHRRIQPVSAGGRRELPVQQAPQGTSAENREAGMGKSQPGSRHPLSLQLLDPPECGNGFVEAGEECDCGSVQVSRPGGLPCGPGMRAWAPGRESTE